MVIDFQIDYDLLAEKIAAKVMLPKEEPKQEKGTRIDGIRGVAAFLHCSISKAQDLKNKGIIPFYNIGKKVYFFENEVTNALKGR